MPPLPEWTSTMITECLERQTLLPFILDGLAVPTEEWHLNNSQHLTSGPAGNLHSFVSSRVMASLKRQVCLRFVEQGLLDAHLLRVRSALSVTRGSLQLQGRLASIGSTKTKNRDLSTAEPSQGPWRTSEVFYADEDESAQFSHMPFLTPPSPLPPGPDTILLLCLSPQTSISFLPILALTHYRTMSQGCRSPQIFDDLVHAIDARQQLGSGQCQ